MKKIITLLLIISAYTLKAQTPVCNVYYGCGGATVTASAGDLLWSNVTYNFQRAQGTGWITIHTSISNYHIVTPGDITVPTQYRCELRNNVTGATAISNGVTVNPGKFSDIVAPLSPRVTPYWGTDVTSGVNSFLVEPYAIGTVTTSRPPFVYEYKKASEATWQPVTSTNAVFINNVDANTVYEFRVTDYCGNVSTILNSELISQATATYIAENCSGVTIGVNVTANGQNFSFRQPFTFGYALIPPGTPTNPVPDAILNAINYTFPAGNITGLANGQYVVRGQDKFGVKTKYRLITFDIKPSPPVYAGIAFGSSYCLYNISIHPSSFMKGIRVVGSGQPYIFSSGPVFVDVPAGQLYEMVLRDTCGRISSSVPISIANLPPRINGTPITSSNCKYIITVQADVCTTPEYGIQLSGSTTTNWQSSNVFSNLPMTQACHTIFVKDVTSGLITQQQVCTPGISTNAYGYRSSPDCISRYYINVGASGGVPPYSYSISYDGVNFASPVSSSTFYSLPPGTYTVKATDACGLSSETTGTTVELGSVYALKESGVNTNCTNGDTLGGYLKFELRHFDNDKILSPPPYHFTLKEVVSVAGGVVQYGKTVYSGQTNDDIISFKGLEGNKSYGFFVSNSCGQSFTSANRVPNMFFIPAFSGPAPDIDIDISNCNAPFIQANNLPAGAMVRIFSGQDTTGTLQPMTNPNTSAVLAGGFYSVKINTANYNGCYWEKVQTLFVKTNDSTRSGEIDLASSSFFCSGQSSPVRLYETIKNETPGGNWTSLPAIVWSNQANGEFIPADLPEGNYLFKYEVTSNCGMTVFVEVPIVINADYCNFSPLGDYESAQTPSGCKTYSGNEWQHVFTNDGKLVYSINAGSGNTIQSACWGVRAEIAFGTPRSTVINGNTVYFAFRNFYIEPSGTTITNPPVRVRLYFAPAEIDLLLNYLRSNGFPAATINDLRILKKQAGPGSPVNLEVANDPGTPSSLYSVITPIAAPFGSFGSYYFELEINSFSELAVVFSNNFALPVTWLSVNGQIQNGNGVINWATANETNTRSFEIEHSSTGADYTKIGTVAAAGQSNTTKRYEFVHSSPVNGRNYYRIRQIDVDGKFSYSMVVVLHSIVENSMTITPNPVHQSTTVYFKEDSRKTIRLLNTNGQVVLNQLLQQGTYSYPLNMSHLPAGMYMLQVQFGSKTETHKIIKQ